MLGYHDIMVFHFINSVLVNPIFDLVMPLATRLGGGEVIFILAVFIIFFSAPEKRMSGILLLAGLTAGYFITDFLKTYCAMPRPFMSMPDVRLLIGRASGFSLPSGHTSIAFMTAFILTRFFGKDWLWYSLAGLVAFSRIYLGVHYPSDALVGALIGMMVGYMLVKASERSKPD